MVDRQRQLEDLLLQAPPGQVIEVYKSLKTIAPDADLTAAVDKWNRKSLKCADNGIILSDHTAISPGTLDTRLFMLYPTFQIF